MKSSRKTPESDPIVVRQGSVTATIYPTVNRIYRVDPATGQRQLKREHPQFTLVYWHSSKRVRKKFTALEEARAEANLAVVKLANGESEILKLTGLTALITSKPTNGIPRPTSTSVSRITSLP
ncbi:MAG: hypothetical protein HY043_04790 [Verrucomicrobia bacterium]|nr:hypothetical protein [Verrucomicrobiota bacterium]